MRIEKIKSLMVSSGQAQAIAKLAKLGFGENPSLRADTEEHIAAAAEIQLAYDNGEVIAFAMYRPSLWLSRS